MGEINKDREQNSITMAETEVIDVIYENGVWKPIEKVEPIERSDHESAHKKGGGHSHGDIRNVQRQVRQAGEVRYV